MALTGGIRIFITCSKLMQTDVRLGVGPPPRLYIIHPIYLTILIITSVLSYIDIWTIQLPDPFGTDQMLPNSSVPRSAIIQIFKPGASVSVDFSFSMDLGLAWAYCKSQNCRMMIEQALILVIFLTCYFSLSAFASLHQ
jgi:hypothetical protein